MTRRDSDVKSIFRSRSGIHVSAYVKNSGSVAGLQSEIDACIAAAAGLLRSVSDPKRVADCLTPLKNLRSNGDLLQCMRSDFAVFANENWWRVIEIGPVATSFTVVADTFHVKPLLRREQSERRFLAVCISDEYATMLSGDDSGTETLGRLAFNVGGCSKTLSPANFRRRFESRLSLIVHWVNSVLVQRSECPPAEIFIGSTHAVDPSVRGQIRHQNVAVMRIAGRDDGGEPLTVFRARIAEAQKERLAKAVTLQLSALRSAQVAMRTSTNLEDIVRHALSGSVETLYVADNVNIFGKINRADARVVTHEAQVDHEDDDVLDDLSQIVAELGGRVVLLNQASMPGESSALAVLTDHVA